MPDGGAAHPSLFNDSPELTYGEVCVCSSSGSKVDKSFCGVFTFGSQSLEMSWALKYDSGSKGFSMTSIIDSPLIISEAFSDC